MGKYGSGWNHDRWVGKSYNPRGYFLLIARGDLKPLSRRAETSLVWGMGVKTDVFEACLLWGFEPKFPCF